MAGSFTFPACETPAPIYIKDGAFSLDGANRLADRREFDFTFNNKLIFEEDPFPLGSVDIARMERDDRREYPLTFKLFGEPGDATHAPAMTKDEMPYSLRIGAADNGITIAMTGDAILEQNGSPTREGRANRSVLNLSALAIKADDEPSPIEVTPDLP